MFNGSFLRVCRILRFVKKIRFSLHESGWTKPWCPGLVSHPSAKAQEPLARSRGQWQEVEGLLFNPKKCQLVHIFSFHSQGVVCLCIFPTGQIALDFEPSTSCHWFLHLALGRDTKPGHHALVRPDSRRENRIFCTICNFINALKQESLNIMHLHNGRTTDGP